MIRARLAHWLLISPAQALLLAVIGLPSVYVAWLGLTQSSYGQAPQWTGLDNYRAVLADLYFWRATVNTLIVVNAVVYLELAVALGMAVLFASGVPARRLMVAIVLAPYAISEVVAVTIWKFMMDPEVGPVTHALAALGLPQLDWAVDPSAALVLVSLISIWLHLPFTFILLYAARLAVPGDLYEAARIDGAGAWAQFRHVTVPVLMPAILVALLFRYIFGFRLFSEVWLLTQGGPARSTEVLAVYLYRAAFRYGDFGAAAATGWLMVVLSVLVAAYWLRRMYREMFAYA